MPARVQLPVTITVGDVPGVQVGQIELSVGAAGVVSGDISDALAALLRDVAGYLDQTRG